MMRVNRSSALAKWNNAMLKIKTLEAEISKTKDEKVVEVKLNSVDLKLQHFLSRCCFHNDNILVFIWHQLLLMSGFCKLLCLFLLPGHDSRT